MRATDTDAPRAPKSSEPRTVARHYTLAEVSLLLLTFALCALAFDARGLVTWAGRLEVGPAQDMWLRVLEPLDDRLAHRGLHLPRQKLLAIADQLSARYASPAEDLAHGDTPRATASPTPLAELSGPAAHLPLPHGDEVALGGSADPDPRTPAHDDGRVTILLVGDSMMQIGLAPGIAKAFADDPKVRVLRETRIGTGLSRPDVFDWPTEMRTLVAQEHPRFIVASFGGNDAQDLRLDGAIVPFGTREWDRVYSARVRGFMTDLAAGGAQVLWVGLPPMRADDFSLRVAKLNDIDVEAAKELSGVEFLDPTPLVTGDDRAFTTYLPAPGGGLVQVRGDDGVHLSTAGGELVADRALTWIRARAMAAGSAAFTAPDPSAPGRAPPPGG